MSDETLGQDASHRRKAAERAVAESIHWIRAYIPDYGPSKKYAMLVDHARIIRPKIRSCEKDHSHQKETREVMIGVSGVSSVYVGRGVAPPVGRDRARRAKQGCGSADGLWFEATRARNGHGAPKCMESIGQ